MDIISLLARAVDQNGIDPDNLNLTTTDPQMIGMQRKYCKLDLCPIEWATMKYRPTIVGSAIYAILFSVLLFGQLYYGIRHKTWSYLVVLWLGILGEIIGYNGRILLNRNPFPMKNFLMSVQPALLSANMG